MDHMCHTHICPLHLERASGIHNQRSTLHVTASPSAMSTPFVIHRLRSVPGTPTTDRVRARARAGDDHVRKELAYGFEPEGNAALPMVNDPQGYMSPEPTQRDLSIAPKGPKGLRKTMQNKRLSF
jgi:hypothetical protein